MKARAILGCLLISATMAAGASRDTNQVAKLTSRDRDFMKKTMANGLAQVDLGKLARRQTTSRDVQDYGDRVAREQDRINDDLRDLARKKDVDLPRQMDLMHQQLRNHLNDMQGLQFDRAYIDAMVEDHDADVDRYEKAERDTDDPDLKNFISNNLHTIQNHQRDARDLQRKYR